MNRITFYRDNKPVYIPCDGDKAEIIKHYTAKGFTLTPSLILEPEPVPDPVTQPVEPITVEPKKRGRKKVNK